MMAHSIFFLLAGILIAMASEMPIHTALYQKMLSIVPDKSAVRSFHDIHNLSAGAAFGIRALHDGRTWHTIRNSIVTGGHQWCAVQKDLWSCTGLRYVERLKQTPHYNRSHFDPRRLRHGTKIFFEGNSYLAEVLYSIICETNPSVIVQFGSATNDILAHYPEANVTIFGIDNGERLQTHFHRITQLMQEVHYCPTFVILGSVNYHFDPANPSISINLERQNWYQSIWPNATILPWFASHLGTDCKADGQDCLPGEGHQCFPGPVLRTAEHLMERLLSVDSQSTVRHHGDCFATSVDIITAV